MPVNNGEAVVVVDLEFLVALFGRQQLEYSRGLFGDLGAQTFPQGVNALREYLQQA